MQSENSNGLHGDTILVRTIRPGRLSKGLNLFTRPHKNVQLRIVRRIFEFASVIFIFIPLTYVVFATGVTYGSATATHILQQSSKNLRFESVRGRHSSVVKQKQAVSAD